MAGAIIPHGSIFLAVLLYALGMVVFTMIMGNAFAAFPVMAAAIGVPILIQQDGGKPAVIGAVGMLAGFCGTLMTPMAANFNIVPAALLELKSQYGVIRVQIATAIPLLDRQHPHPLRRGVSPVTTLDADLASHMARIALGHVRKEYPHKLDHVLTGDEDALPPRVLHPIFYGSFDWHSCVHGWWTLLTLGGCSRRSREADAIAELADDSFTAEKVGGRARLSRPAARAAGSSGPTAGPGCSSCTSKRRATMKRWAAELEPLARAFAERLSRLSCTCSPIRSASERISTRPSR